MNVDALTLTALVGEFHETLIGARIDDVIQPTPHAVALQTYGAGRNRWLIASAHPQLARVHYIERKPRKLVQDPPAFVMLLRKYLEGTRVSEVRQPAWERLIEIGCVRGPQEAANRRVWLVVEIMGRVSNLILRDDNGLILGSLRHVGAGENRYRTIAPTIPYRYPPPQTRALHGETMPRIEPENVTASELEEAGAEMLAAGPKPRGRAGRKGLAGRTQPLIVADVLMAHLAGFGRELAGEVVARALGAPDAPLTTGVRWNRVAHEARELATLSTTKAWEPTLVYRSADEHARPFAFAVYPPRQYGDGAILRPAASVNEMLATYYEDAEWYNAVEGAKQELRHALQTQRDRCLRKDEALRGELALLDEMQQLREEADILLAFQQEVPEHASSFRIENPFTAGEGDAQTVTIALDPRLSAVENANKKYDRYHKLQRAGSRIPPQIEANELELAHIEQLRTDLALAETPAEIALVRAEVAEAGYLRGAKDAGNLHRLNKGVKGGKAGKSGKGGKGGKSGNAGQAAKRGAEGGSPLRRQSSDGFLLLVGKNSRQNEEVTFREASANDLWLHARGVPGAHVIIKSGGRPVPQTTEREAAALAAYYSQSRAAGSVPVDITQQRYVRHMKGGGPGMVIYEREHTIQVSPAEIEE